MEGKERLLKDKSMRLESLNDEIKKLENLKESYEKYDDCLMVEVFDKIYNIESIIGKERGAELKEIFLSYIKDSIQLKKDKKRRILEDIEIEE